LETLLPGYRSVATIGQGARSVIYQVIRESTGQHYALKRVVRKDPLDHRFIEQVEIEYEVAHGIEHPHLRHAISIHRSKRWLQTTEVLLLMEYVPGLTVEQHRPARLEHFLSIFGKVAKGLAALHKHGYVHADMKPNNVILGAGGVVKIIDFGQSCPLGHRKGRIQGTPDFIAPEQIRRVPLDQRTDVFNLGATMYWVLTGESYPTELPQGLRGTIERAKPKRVKSPKEINEKIPLALSQLIMDCCKPNPAERPHEMQHVLSRLEMVRTLWRKKLDELKTEHRRKKGAAVTPKENPSAANEQQDK
jgi:serine/threonine-protein kinase